MRPDFPQSPILTARARALAALVAALVALLSFSAAASAEDLYSELDAKQAKLDEIHERQGVLTSTITAYRDRIERLTAEVAVLRTQEAAVEVRLAAKQAELDQRRRRAGGGEETPRRDAGAAEAGAGGAARPPGGDL